MKLNINKIKPIPKTIDNNFGVCVYGNPIDDVLNWIIENKFENYISGEYTNIIIPYSVELSEIFEDAKVYEWMDGFSPNLNKKLHIGHFSNLVLAKAFKSLGICNNTVAIYGDTVEGKIDVEHALNLITLYKLDFQLIETLTLFASKMTYNGTLLKDGIDDYIGTKVFEIGSNKVVGIKSNGDTSYFYQDAALAEYLNASTLYLTGSEQNNHFELLKALYPNIHHIGLGLLKLATAKMSSRVGNVILMEDFIERLKEKFNDDIQLVYNVFAGFILKSAPEKDKIININSINNFNSSLGLYISYTMARLQSAGCEVKQSDNFIYRNLEFAYLKARFNLTPNTLFEALVEHCKGINLLYGTNIIKDNAANKHIFEMRLQDLVLGANKLGLFTIKKV